jgi:hypothetical protein
MGMTLSGLVFWGALLSSVNPGGMSALLYGYGFSESGRYFAYTAESEPTFSYLYSADGSVKRSLQNVPEVVTGKNLYWYIRDNKLCARHYDSNAGRCISFPSTMVPGTLKAVGDDVLFWIAKGPQQIMGRASPNGVWQRVETIEAVSYAKWCAGQGVEFAYQSDGVTHFDGSFRFELKSPWSFTCAVNGAHVAFDDDGTPYVDHIEVKNVNFIGHVAVSDIQPFKSGWFFDFGDKFELVSGNGVVYAWGWKPKEVLFRFSDSRIFLLVRGQPRD